MSERWETIPVRRGIRKALFEWDSINGYERGVTIANEDLYKAARQFREDVLAEPELMTVEEYENYRKDNQDSSL